MLRSTPSFEVLRPLVVEALAWARRSMPGTPFVADAAWILHEAQAQPERWARRRREFAVVSRCTNGRPHRAFYGLLAWAMVALQREDHARRYETRPFGNHDSAIHGQEPDERTVVEAQSDGAWAPYEADQAAE